MANPVENLASALDNDEKEGRLTARQRWLLGILYTISITLVLTTLLGHFVEPALMLTGYTPDQLIPHIYVDLLGILGGVLGMAATLYLVSATGRKS